MPPFHHRVRGQRDDLRPLFLPTAAGGTAVAVPDASWYVAIRACHAWLDPTPTSAATAQALQRPAAVSWPHPQAPVCRLCAGPRARPPAAGCPPPRIVPTRGRRRQVDTSRHCCPDPDCLYGGWLGLGNIRANGHP